MQTVTFTCPHCNNLMAATTDMLGQQVHCPTCHNVVIAPPAMLSPSSVPELSFDAPPREAHDSIFGEVPEEDVLGGTPPPPKVEMPPDDAPSTSSTNRTGFASYPPPDPTAPLAPAAFAPMPPVEPNPPAPAPPPLEPPTYWINTAMPDTAAPAPAADPWQPPRPEAPTEHWQPDATHHAPDEPGGEPVRFRRPEDPHERQKGRSLMLAILGPYSIAMTLIAMYYLYKYESFSSKNHPLELIPDFGDENRPKKRDPSATINLRGPKPELELPDRLKVKLAPAAPLRVGDLEVTPLGIEQRRIRYHVQTATGSEPHTFAQEALVLQLRLKNVSSDWVFSPTDPLFDRYYEPRRDKTAKPYTLVQVGDRFFYGGAMDIVGVAKQEKRRYIDGQENDDKPLNPGEERTTVICTDPRDDTLIPAVAKSAEPMTWRVQLRRGVVHYKGRDRAVTAVIGVEFTAADVKKVTRN